MKTKYDLFRDAQAITQTACDAMTKELGRLRVGPSNKGGVYLTANVPTNDQPHRITNITREEAAFIVAALTDIYGLSAF